MKYRGIEIIISKYGTYHLFSPVNGKRRIFRTLELAKNYIDNAEDIEFMARHLGE